LAVRSGPLDDGGEAALATYAEELKQAGIRLLGAPILPTQPLPGFASASLYAPVAEIGGARFDAPTLLMREATRWILVGLLGPNRSVSGVWWAVARRAFEIVRDSLRLTPFTPGNHQEARL
jgi:hypothetical protein